VKSVLPTVLQAVEIVGMQITRKSQSEQLRFMAETQGRGFAEQVAAKVKAAGKVAKK
jgi:hypothetical protein